MNSIYHEHPQAVGQQKIRLWSLLRPVSTDIRCVVSAGGVLDLCYADEEALGGGAGAVARFLGCLECEIVAV